MSPTSEQKNPQVFLARHGEGISITRVLPSETVEEYIPYTSIKLIAKVMNKDPEKSGVVIYTSIPECPTLNLPLYLENGQETLKALLAREGN